MVLLDTGTPGTSREIFSEDASSSPIIINIAVGVENKVLFTGFDYRKY